MDEYVECDLTATEKAVFNAVVAFIGEHEYPPTVRELCQITGLKSPGWIHANLCELKRKGYISFVCGANRTIRVLKGGCE